MVKLCDLKVMEVNKMKLIKNENTAEIVGLSFGDGSLTRRLSGDSKDKLRFQLRGDITEDREHYTNYIIPLFNKTLGINIKSVTCNGKDKSYGIASYNQEVCKSLQELGIPIGVKGELQIPMWITSKDVFTKCFIRGLMDTDGSVYCGRDYNYPKKGYIKIRMSITSISKNLMEQTSSLLKHLGIHNLLLKPYQPKVQKNRKEFSKIQIDGPNVIKYFEIISSKNPKHITKFEVWKRFGFCPPRTKLTQRYSMLSASNNIAYAGVSEPGQMSMVEGARQKPYALVAARVQIPSPAFNVPAC